MKAYSSVPLNPDSLIAVQFSALLAISTTSQLTDVFAVQLGHTSLSLDKITAFPALETPLLILMGRQMLHSARVSTARWLWCSLQNKKIGTLIFGVALRAKLSFAPGSWREGRGCSCFAACVSAHMAHWGLRHHFCRLLPPSLPRQVFPLFCQLVLGCPGSCY